jgi:hypothetical protein
MELGAELDTVDMVVCYKPMIKSFRPFKAVLFSFIRGKTIFILYFAIYNYVLIHPYHL